MQFDFVFVAFASQHPAPLISNLRNMNEGYKFAPLASDGSIYTADVDLWRSNNGIDSDYTNVFCPEYSDVVKTISFAEQSKSYLLVALTYFKEFSPPGMPGVYLNLVSWEEIAKTFSDMHLVNVGFDIVDSWTGLSALANIGYSIKDIEQLNSMSLKSNQFGLLSTENDAKEFANFASTVAPEHAPFAPVKIFVRMPKKHGSGA
jgi:hypothetical protein